MSEVKKVSVSAILGMLDAGKTREVIGEELGLTKAQVRAVFQDPQLKGKKVRVNHLAGIEIVHDVATESAPAKEAKAPKAAKVTPEATPEAASTASTAAPVAEEAAPAAAEQLPDEPAQPVETKSPWDR